MRYTTLVGVFTVLCISGWALAAGPWIIEPFRFQDGPFYTVTGGGYNGVNYKYSTGQGIQRAFWRFDGPDVPAQPKLYIVEQWVPTVFPVGVTQWYWLPIEVTFSPTWEGDTGEEGQNFSDIPWNPGGTNHQWVGMSLNGPAGDFQMTTGAHAPASAACTGFGTVVWMQKGSLLYTKWDFPFPNLTHAVTAIRITEFSSDPVPTCGPASNGGPIDLRCVGNSDPLYTNGEPFSNSQAFTVDGNTFAVQDYYRPCWPASFSPGLPINGLYTAHLAGGDVQFQLLYDGLNSIKWRGGDTSGTFSRDNVYTLNGVAGREFVPDEYDKLYFISTKGGGSGGKLNVNVLYSDNTTQNVQANLFDWFGQNGDATSVAVGFEGNRRSEGGIGFRRLDNNGSPGNGGDTGGAFLFVHEVDVDQNKTLSQVQLSLSEITGGEMVIFGGTFIRWCGTPVFDVVGGGVNGDEPDGSVDQQDFGYFQACYTGPTALVTSTDCSCLDVTHDNHVDTDDYGYFQACATISASSMPPPLGCDQP